jgi:cell wall-associated NlpC family hydrolase/exonuclease VII small subunit
MTRTRKRLAVSAMILVVIAPLTVVAATTSLATRVTKADVASARSKLNTLNHQLEVVVEQYNGARVLLQQAQQKLATARSQMNQAQATADAARAQLGQRAAEAYTGMGSQLDTLLGTQSIADFSDRLEFMGALAQSDADLATSADAARQQAAWASRQYSDAVAAAHGQLDSVNAQRDHISGLLTQAQTLYRQTAANYQAYLAAQRAALRAQRRQDNTGTTAGTTAPTSGNSGGAGGGGYHSPPPNLTGATAAIAAAKSVLGVQYVFAAADPNVGFDCSGLTMWSWAHAGVSLPHNAAMQYDALPHVALSQIQPGDLLFFFSPISHVAMYLGGGMIIHATHPGPGGEVHIEALDPVWRPLIVGAARP